jgi:hypothetical protein
MYSKTFVDDNTSSYHSLVTGHVPRFSNSPIQPIINQYQNPPIRTQNAYNKMQPIILDYTSQGLIEITLIRA